MSDLLFFAFTALTAGGALGVVLNKNAVHAAFCLLLSLLGTAGLFVLLNAYLLAALLILVYAGAVVALFVFVVMLIGMQGGTGKPTGRLASVGAFLAFIALLAGAFVTLTREPLPPPVLANMPPVGAELKLYAYQLFTTYLLPVEVSGFLLLVAMIGVIVLAKKDKPEAKA